MGTFSMEKKSRRLHSRVLALFEDVGLMMQHKIWNALQLYIKLLKFYVSDGFGLNKVRIPFAEEANILRT